MIREFIEIILENDHVVLIKGQYSHFHVSYLNIA